MEFLDYIILIIYFFILITIGIKANKKIDDPKVSMLPIALSIAATTISANGFIGGAAWGYYDGMSAFLLQISIPISLFIAGYFFLPYYYKIKVKTCYEYIGLRFNRNLRVFSALLYIMMSFIQVGAMIYIPSKICSYFLEIDLNIMIAIVLLVVIVYTSLGGINAVILTDVMQIIIVWGSILLFLYVISDKYESIYMLFSMISESSKLSSFDYSFGFDNGYSPIITLLGGIVLWLQYYISDQTIAQRIFVAKNEKDVIRSLAVGGIVMNVMYFILVSLGIMLFIYFEGAEFDDYNNVMLHFIDNDVPSIAKGLIIAAIFSAAMSSVDSIINAISTVIKNDIIPKHSQRKYNINYIMILLASMIYISILSLYGNDGSSILEVVAGYFSLVNGSLLAVFILGLTTKTANSIGISIGFVIGVIFSAVSNFIFIHHWLWFGLFGFVSCAISGYLFSLLFRYGSNFCNYTINDDLRKLNRIEVILLVFFIFQYIVLFLLNG